MMKLRLNHYHYTNYSSSSQRSGLTSGHERRACELTSSTRSIALVLESFLGLNQAGAQVSLENGDCTVKFQKLTKTSLNNKSSSSKKIQTTLAHPNGRNSRQVYHAHCLEIVSSLYAGVIHCGVGPRFKHFESFVH